MLVANKMNKQGHQGDAVTMSILREKMKVMRTEAALRERLERKEAKEAGAEGHGAALRERLEWGVTEETEKESPFKGIIL